MWPETLSIHIYYLVKQIVDMYSLNLTTDLIKVHLSSLLYKFNTSYAHKKFKYLCHIIFDQF